MYEKLAILFERDSLPAILPSFSCMTNQRTPGEAAQLLGLTALDGKPRMSEQDTAAARERLRTTRVDNRTYVRTVLEGLRARTPQKPVSLETNTAHTSKQPSLSQSGTAIDEVAGAFNF